MMRQRLLLFGLAALVIYTGCGKQREGGGAPPEQAAMLDPGTGALLISFPELSDFVRADWLAQVTLIGVHDTKSLPRIPLADRQSVLVLNIPHGTYHAVARAWLRKQVPAAGGTFDNLQIRAGELTILRGQPLPPEQAFDTEIPMTFVAVEPWTLRTTELFQDYIADVLRSTVKG